MRPAKICLARALSIAGHPAILLPVIGFSTAYQANAPRDLFYSIGACTVLALGLMAWSRARVRRGKWRHVDASGVGERREWNRGVLIVVTIGIAAALILGRWVLLTALGSAALIIAVAIATQNRLKISQHVAFAAMASVMATLGNLPIALATAALTVAIGWSRRVLGRHTAAEVWVGLLVGSSAGAAFLLGLTQLG